MKKSKKLFALVLSLILAFTCFAAIPMTSSAVSNGIYLARLNYTGADSWTYLQNEFNLAAGTYRFDVDYVTAGSVTPTVRFRSGTTTNSTEDNGSHISVNITWAGGTFNIYLRDSAFTGTGTIYFANPVLKVSDGSNVTGDNLIWDFSKQYTEGGATVTNTYAWGGKWYRNNGSANATFKVEADGRNMFSTSDKGPSYMAKLNYKSGDTWTYLRTEMNLAEGTYQFDVDYIIDGDTSLYAGVDNDATKISATAEDGHLTMLFTAGGSTIGLKLSDANFTGANVIYLVNPVLKLVEGGKVTGDNLVWDFSKQFDSVGSTISTDYGWNGRWYRSNDSAGAVFTVEKDIDGALPERLYLAKLNYTVADRWKYLQTEMNLEAGTYQFDVDYVTSGSVEAFVNPRDAIIDSTTDNGNHITVQFTWSTTANFQLQIRDRNFTGAGIIYLANPVLKLVDNGEVTGPNLVWDFYKQFAFAGGNITSDYGWNGRWYKSSDDATVIFTAEVDSNGIFAQAAHTEHSLGDEWEKDADNHWKVCTECGEEVDKAIHTYDTVVTAPTCKNGGYTTYTCTVCGYSYKADETSPAAHTGGTATCTSKAICTNCGEEYGEIDPNNHPNAAIQGYVAPTCTEAGQTGVFSCPDCHTEVEASQSIPELGHDFTNYVSDNNATCTACGTKTAKCSRCDATDTVENLEDPELGHDYIAVETKATCKAGGYTTYTCSRCKDSFVADETAALAHKPAAAVKENEKAATYTKAGSYDSVVYCSVCSTEISRKTVTVPALVAPTYTITYKLNGGTNVTGNPKTYKITSADITLKAATKKGYKFGGWYSDSKLTKKVTKIAKGSTGNKTLYAKWTAVAYTVTYKLNSGKNVSGNPKSYKVTTSTITLKAPTRKGYKFGGWYSDSKFTKKVTKIAKGSTGNKTLYAKWTVITYKITYKLNNGKNAAKNPKSYKVTTSTITLKAATRKGYTFKGWYNGSKKVTKIAKGSTGNITLTAKWAKKK